MARAWPPEDLARRVGLALDAAERAIDSLLDRDPRIDLAELEVTPDKVVAETALLLRAAAAIPGESANGIAARIPELVRRLTPHARGDRVRAAIVLRPALARDFALAHVSLAAAGWPDPELDRLLERSLADPTSTGRERQPHRELEQHWIDGLRGAPRDAPDLSRTALETGIDLLSGSRDDAYALTHSVIYATDFGALSPRLSRPGGSAAAEAGSALARALDDDDFDLVAELLLSWPLLGVPWDPVPSFAFGVLAGVEDQVGLLPSLAIDGDGYRRQPPGSRPGYFAATTYHTAYVMGLLCAAILHRDAGPVTTWRSPAAYPELMDCLNRQLPRGTGSPQWERHLAELPEDRRGPLAPLLLDVVVGRAVRRLEFGTVREVLETLVREGAPSTPLTVQAARLLSRLTDGLAGEPVAARPAAPRAG